MSSRGAGHIGRTSARLFAVSTDFDEATSESEGEVHAMIDICDFAVGLSRRLYDRLACARPGHRMMEQWSPLGVVVGPIAALDSRSPPRCWSGASTARGSRARRASSLHATSACATGRRRRRARRHRLRIGQSIVDNAAMGCFLVSALGSAGDVHPFIAISRALRARGHDVRMMSAPHFEERIRAAGIAFAPLGAPGDYERLVQRPELWHPRRGARFILDELLVRLPEGYATTAAAVTSPETVLVGSTLSWGMRLVQEQRAMRGATVHLSPVCIQSATAPAIVAAVGDLSWMPTGVVGLLQRTAERIVLDRLIAPRVNAMRAALALPPVERIWSRWMHSPDCVIGAWPAWFAPAQPDWPPCAATSGFPMFDDGGAALDARLHGFVDAGPPPIGITAGSAMAHGERFFARAIAACERLDRRAVLITAYPDQLPRPLPASMLQVGYAPFSALLPRLSALVHHGGIGTSAQALAAGLPQLVVPFAHDQFDNAARLERLGVARRLSSAASVDRWVAAIRRVDDRSEPAAAARRWAARMAAEEAEAGPASARIAARLERLATGPIDTETGRSS